MSALQNVAGIAAIVSAIVAVASMIFTLRTRNRVNKFEIEMHKITSGGVFINPIIDELNIHLVVKENLGSDEVGGKMEP